MPDYTKKERAELRRLASLAYERELGRYLAELDKSFAKWRHGELLASELSKEVHDFHQHAARDTWSLYQTPDVSMLVARAISRGILTEQDVPANLRQKLSGTVVLFAERNDGAV